MNGPLSDRDEPPDRADDAVVRSAYANGPRFVSELDEGADDETLSSRLISRLVPIRPLMQGRILAQKSKRHWSHNIMSNGGRLQ